MRHEARSSLRWFSSVSLVPTDKDGQRNYKKTRYLRYSFSVIVDAQGEALESKG